MQSPFSVPLMTGIVLAATVALGVRGGIRRIARVAERVVLFMVIAYSICTLRIVILNIGKAPSIFLEIVRGCEAPRHGGCEARRASAASRSEEVLPLQSLEKSLI